jgi:antitoxin MazE
MYLHCAHDVALQQYCIGARKMSLILRTRIVDLGDLCEIQIPKLLLEQAGIESYVEVEVRSGELIIRATPHPRAGWEEMCRQIVEDGEDGLLDEELCLTEWEINEWQW